jgi:hypothetical protein
MPCFLRNDRNSSVHKQVNVIRRTIDYQWNTLSFFHDAGHVGEQAGSQPWR